MSERDRPGGTVVTLAVIFFAVAMLWGYRALTAGPDTSDEATVSCQSRTVKAGDDLPSSLVTVDVYNGGDTEGLAGTVSTSLQERGFRQGAVANSPSAIEPTTVTILATDQDDPQVQLVAQQFEDVTFRQPDFATSSAVSVVVGDEFERLAEGAPASIKATADVSVCF